MLSLRGCTVQFRRVRCHRLTHSQTHALTIQLHTIRTSLKYSTTPKTSRNENRNHRVPLRRATDESSNGLNNIWENTVVTEDTEICMSEGPHRPGGSSVVLGFHAGRACGTNLQSGRRRRWNVSDQDFTIAGRDNCTCFTSEISLNLSVVSRS
jgi:hypothetical protein